MTEAHSAGGSPERVDARKRPTGVESLDMALMLVVPLASVLVGTLVERLGYRTTVGGQWKFTTAHSSNPVLIGLAGLACAVVIFLLCTRSRSLRRHAKRDALLTPSNDGGQVRLWLTFASFISGVAVGVAIRLYLGAITVGSFFTGASPLIAGLVVGIVFQSTNPAIAQTDRATEVVPGLVEL